ncbi:MAG: aminotransferase class V-fold PLP-dependent enzyme [Tissierellaceae bacterium]|nr:aminotransferase class V-fold PLP-dependent enzyme [Tissierellaceae bacterium]
MPTYLDYNASTPIDERVLCHMVDVYKQTFGNADSRTHMFGANAKEMVEKCRASIAKILAVDKTDLIFTSGSTESNNISTIGMLQHAISTGRNHFITTSIEHKAVLEPLKKMSELGCVVDFIDPDETGRVSAASIMEKVTDRTLLVSVMHINSETGIIQPVSEIGELLSKTKVYFHVDATQSFGKLNDELRSLKYDLLSFTAHKLGGPQGIGGLVVKRGADYRRPPIAPLFYGGQQERGIRPGTIPVALVAGLAMAAELCERESKINWDNCMKIKKEFFEAIKGLRYYINGDQNYCVPNTINISFDGVDAEGVFVALKDFYAFSNGSACTSGNFSPSYVLSAMGLDEDRISSALRLSWDGKTKVDFSDLISYIRTIA